MSQITICYKVTVILTYWGASGEVSELSYKSLLSISSKRSYCSMPNCKHCFWKHLLSIWFLCLYLYLYLFFSLSCICIALLNLLWRKARRPNGKQGFCKSFSINFIARNRDWSFKILSIKQSLDVININHDFTFSTYLIACNRDLRWFLIIFLCFNLFNLFDRQQQG